MTRICLGRDFLLQFSCTNHSFCVNMNFVEMVLPCTQELVEKSTAHAARTDVPVLEAELGRHLSL